ncbi:hypothetical protein [Nitrososphaera sp.]|uniref:hypothetical protein n=1 Tax=Nitrososphaera sp. TaxID=1971748 RepID=UPI00307F243D
MPRHRRINNNNNNNVRGRKLEGNAGETVRIASIVQKGVSAGRSSYVEMRALARQTGQNIRTRVRAILPRLSHDRGLDALLRGLAQEMPEGYTDVLTPNGAVMQEKLDALLSIDADIATCLGILESELKQGNGKKAEAAETLEELVQERKKFVAALRA